MVKPTWFVALWIWIWALYPAQAQGDQTGTVLTHYALHFPPFWFNSDSGVSGYHARLSRQIYQQAGLDLDIELVPYARINKFILPDNVAVIAHGRIKGQDDRLLYPVPQVALNFTLFGLGPEPPQEAISLAGKKVGIRRGSPMTDYVHTQLKDRDQIVSVNSIDQAIRLLTHGRVDYLMTLEEPIVQTLKETNVGHHKLWSRTLLTVKGWPISVVKSHPHAQELFVRIKKAYEELIDEGVITYQNQRLMLTEDF